MKCNYTIVEISQINTFHASTETPEAMSGGMIQPEKPE